MATHNFVSGEGALWAQINGPNTAPVFLGCHLLGDIDQPDGDIELIYCPDPSGPSRFKVVGSVKGAAGAITGTITTDVTDDLDELERARCPFTLFVMMSKAGRKDVFTNFDRAFVLTNVSITSKSLQNLVARTPDDNQRSEQTFDISAETLLRLKRHTVSQQSISETANINDITFCNSQSCRTEEEAAQDYCQTGFAVANHVTGSPAASANVLKTTNGATWTATGADPFQVGENLIAVECFDLSRDSVRVIVGRGDADAGSPVQIAYSDDNGASWTVVAVNALNGHYIPNSHAMFALNRNNIWIGTSHGYIYYSSDAGLTWTAQEAAVISSTAWNAIHFVDENVGWAAGGTNKIARSVDGGTGWSSITGPSARSGDNVLTIFAIDRNRAWIGYDSGHLYYTNDAGVTWTERTFTGSGSGDVRSIKFFDDSLGFLLTDTTGPVTTLHWTVDGGYTWEDLTTPSNNGGNALYVCNEWNVYIAGNAVGGTGFIAKATV